jgi:lipoyl-dependent peroxiredoxin
MKNLYIAHVSVNSGRDGSAKSSDGNLDIKLSFPKELGGNGDAINPEQLFVAGYAACFGSTIKGVAKAKSVNVTQISIDAEGTLSIRDDGAYFISHVKLSVHAEGLGESATIVIEEAKRICAYSNATRGNVITDVVIA